MIRRMERRDIDGIVRGELAQGWHSSEEKYLRRLEDMAAGRSVALVAECGEGAVGYINVYFDRDPPEIVDLGVLEKHRRRGIGSALMDAAEALAFERCETVCIGVGLHSGYGSAQRMYVKRGYVPDGCGAWYDDAPGVPYASYPLDDSLILKLSKTRSDRYLIVKLNERPELVETAARWFHEKWNVPLEAYRESMADSLVGQEAVPAWYLCLDGERIVAGMGVIQNDFHERKDLSPNVCAVFTEPEHRRRGIAGRMLRYVCKDMSENGVDTLYLLTDHTGFYERYGWKFLCMVRGDGEGELSRMYVHRQNEVTAI